MPVLSSQTLLTIFSPIPLKYNCGIENSNIDLRVSWYPSSINKSVEVEEKASSKEEELPEEKNINLQKDSPEDSKEDLESIESIPFISDPPKKKSTKRKKASV